MNSVRKNWIFFAVVVLLCMFAAIKVIWASVSKPNTPINLVLKEQNLDSPIDEFSVPLPLTYHASSSDSERKLLSLLHEILDGNMDAAQRTAVNLTAKYPNFQLAQIIKADIYNARIGKTSMLFSVDNSSGHPAYPHLADLRTELLRRINAIRVRPDFDTWPAELIDFNPNSPYAVVVDATKSRLYLLRKSIAPDGPPELVLDFFMSVGLAGIGKEFEGDNKTPLGVYRILQRRSSSELPIFFGTGALTLDYPNIVDRYLGRTGHGIWIHGSPPETMVRSPEASEGCVVLSNADMSALLDIEGIIGAPVIISESVSWLSSKAQSIRRSAALEYFQSWLKNSNFGELNSKQVGFQRWADRNGNDYLVATVLDFNGHDIMRFFFEYADNEFKLIRSIPRLSARS
jgi:hypothetical protein